MFTFLQFSRKPGHFHQNSPPLADGSSEARIGKMSFRTSHSELELEIEKVSSYPACKTFEFSQGLNYNAIRLEMSPELGALAYLFDGVTEKVITLHDGLHSKHTYRLGCLF